QETVLVPQVFDHLQVDDHVRGSVRDRQHGEVAAYGVDRRVVAGHVRGGGGVVVDADHTVGVAGDQRRPVTLAETGVDDGASAALGRQVEVDDFVAAEPVILLGDPRD